MNPGPAPRPPTDRPRLNLTPSTTNIPGNMSQLSLQSSSGSTRSAFGMEKSVSTSSLPLVRSQTSGGGSVGVTVIKEGWARCKEDGFGGWMWKNKYLILRGHQLDFQKGETGRVSLTIQLKDVTAVNRCDSTPCAFEVTRVANPGTNSAISALINRDLPQKTIICQVKSDDDLYDWVDNIYSRCGGGVSNPTNFNHRVHVGFDPLSGAFVGLPVEWEKLLTASAITKEDYQKNPQAVIEVLEFYSDITKRAQNPDAYPSLTPTPGVHTSQNMQLGHGAGGTSIAPPRPIPPGGMQRLESFKAAAEMREMPSRSLTGTPTQTQRKRSGGDRNDQNQPIQPSQQDMQTARDKMEQEQRRRMEEEARRVHEMREQRQRDREREGEEQTRRDQDAYNAVIPKTRVPIAKQEIGGGFGSAAGDVGSSIVDRYNPSRNAPSAPGTVRDRQQPSGSLRQAGVQRQAPSIPTSQNSSNAIIPRSPYGQKPSVSRDPSPATNGQGSLRTLAKQEHARQPSPNSRNQANANVNGQVQTLHTRGRTNGQTTPPTRLPGPSSQVKPLNVATKQATDTTAEANDDVPDSVRQAEAALTSKAPDENRQKEVRMSSMTELEVMEKLKQVVSKDNPLDSYSKQKKIGQGASGSVYVARIRENATSSIARQVYRQAGPRGQVAIKQMDLRHQPRKELIVNEIIVMKDSKHPNIVNFLDSFLQESNNELWVVMEFMEGGALTDVIDNNPVITQDQIATICFEVSLPSLCFSPKWAVRLTACRRVKDWHIYTTKISSIATSRVTTFCWMVVDT